jgi:secondary thiamine-phosphate synthase enzyme
VYRHLLNYDTRAKSEIRTITADLRRCVAASGVRSGSLLAYSLHTTLGLMIQETEERHLCEDVLDYLGFVIEDDGELYRHRGHLHPRSNGADTDRNAPSHLRQILVNQHLVLDIYDGELVLGPWQDVALAEFDGPRPGRQVLVKVWADPVEGDPRVGELASLRVGESGTFEPMAGLRAPGSWWEADDDPHHQLTNSPTHQLATNGKDRDR